MVMNTLGNQEKIMLGLVLMFLMKKVMNQNGIMNTIHVFLKIMMKNQILFHLKNFDLNRKKKVNFFIFIYLIKNNSLTKKNFFLDINNSLSSSEIVLGDIPIRSRGRGSKKFLAAFASLNDRSVNEEKIIKKNEELTLVSDSIESAKKNNKLINNNNLNNNSNLNDYEKDYDNNVDEI